ncbi:608_t:CDS:1 [Cetraspora pellucida]|uniref:608_t:CDS:1 n=1 Tax=Cetraspora pellucida TaxID=1433469 RepID=A0ACA9MH73_9GLOM|nr:608_t:CDS:1 [Cetraspora pellucida]
MLLVQKKSGPNLSEINKATRLFSDLANLNYEFSYNDYIYFQYLSNSKDNVTLLDTYYFNKIFDKYIIWVADKKFTVVNHPSEVYRIPDIHKCIDKNLPLHLILDIDMSQKPDLINSKHPSLDGYKISHENLLSRILIAYADIIYFDLKHLIILNAFTLASSSNANKCSWHIVYKYAYFVDYRDLRGFVKKVAKRVKKPYSKFINIDLYKSCFSPCFLGSAKKDRVKRPAISSFKKEYRELEDYLVQPKSDSSEI